jgi:hypothetical protein
MDDNEPGAATTVFAVVGGLIGAVLSTWWTIIAFTGGTMPVIGYETEGGLGQGLLWVFVIDPIVVMVMAWVFMLIALPVIGIEALVRRRS